MKKEWKKREKEGERVIKGKAKGEKRKYKDREGKIE